MRRMKRVASLARSGWWKTACAVCALCAATAIGAIGLRAQTFKTLHTFDYTDGADPRAGLVQATNGYLYGTTEGGGANLYYGTIFKITPNGTLTTLYSFCPQSGCATGNYPDGGVVQASNGNFYGTTFEGGANGNGTVFEFTPSGTLTTLYSFCAKSNCTDGGQSSAGLVQAAGGNFYGTTGVGGANGYGTVFKITPSGTLKTLYSFCSQSGCSDGEYPDAPLIQATDGNFYGTIAGGANGYGAIFKITPDGTLTSLYSFCSQSGCTDGAFPQSGLIQDTDGNFYGTTASGGANGGDGGCFDGCGTVFKITPSGTLTTLYNFCSQSGCTDGAQPYAALIQATDGNFYGTTSLGGANNYGTLYKVTPSGSLTTLYNFCSQAGCTDGYFVIAALAQDTNGRFYGTTFFGGASGSACTLGCGTVFSLSVGLGPFVETQTTSGKVGAPVKILGTDLTGATSVTFNGTAATFTVVSSSLIGTTVPSGATTGTVQVVTPGGTLSSNVPFRVLP